MVKTLRILVITPEAASHVHSQSFLELLFREGCEVTVFGTEDPYPHGRAKYRFVPMPTPRVGRSFLRKIFGRKGGDSIATGIVVQLWRRALRRIDADLMHVNWMDDLAYYAALTNVHPLVVWPWGSDINVLLAPDADGLQREKVARTLNAATRVAVISEAMGAVCNQVAGNSLPLRVCPFFGVDGNLFRPGYEDDARQFRCELGIPAEAKIILSPRGWNEKYRPKDIVEAFAAALQRSRNPAVLVLLGMYRGESGTGYEREVEAAISKVGIEKHIRRVDAVPKERMPVAYAMSDIVVNYPRIDALGALFFEALACERPIVTCLLTTYNGTFVERYCECVAMNDEEGLANAMARLIDGVPNKRLENLTEGRAFILENYEKSIGGQRLMDIYRELL